MTTGAWVAVIVGAGASATAICTALPLRAWPVRLPEGSAGLASQGRPGGAGHQPPHAWRGIGVGLASVVAFFVAPPLALLPPVAGWARGRITEVRRARVRDREIADELPDAVDLLLLCTEAGWSLPVAHPQVAARVAAPVGPALRAADATAERGQPRSEALVDALTPLGDRARSLGHVLADHLRYGVPLVPGLDRLGLELRLDRRRRAELEARRVPVRLLGPLVACILPSFALLTVVPLLAASLRALPT